MIAAVLSLVSVLLLTASLTTPCPNCRPPSCPSNYRFDGKTCVYNQDYPYTGGQSISPTCPQNYYWNGSVCNGNVGTPNLSCPPGYIWTGLNCLTSYGQSSNYCPSGYTFAGIYCA